MESGERREWIEAVTRSRVTAEPELIQELWSGYGRIERWRLSSVEDPETLRSVILKVVDPGGASEEHPRGWASSLSDERKRASYRIERDFYRRYSAQLGPDASVPGWLGDQETATGGHMLLEDLDASGLAARRERPSDAEIRACLRWLAAFHATFLGQTPDGLWERGTYWHLATRPDELAATEDAKIRAAAPEIDARLGAARWRTFVHGDAKVANFCFRSPAVDGPRNVAAVDFQYVGGGVGVQDVSYLLGSCLTEEQLERLADGYLEMYFAEFRSFVRDADRANEVEREWRELWPFAWADFHRFLCGWAPDHWKLSGYSERMVRWTFSN